MAERVVEHAPPPPAARPYERRAAGRVRGGEDVRAAAPRVGSEAVELVGRRERARDATHDPAAAVGGDDAPRPERIGPGEARTEQAHVARPLRERVRRRVRADEAAAVAHEAQQRAGARRAEAGAPRAE